MALYLFSAEQFLKNNISETRHSHMSPRLIIIMILIKHKRRGRINGFVVEFQSFLRRNSTAGAKLKLNQRYGAIIHNSDKFRLYTFVYRGLPFSSRERILLALI